MSENGRTGGAESLSVTFGIGCEPHGHLFASIAKIKNLGVVVDGVVLGAVAQDVVSDLLGRGVLLG